TTKRETEAHYGKVNDVYNEREMYTIDDRYQPYNREDREHTQPNSESQWEGRYFTEEMLSEKEDSELYINPWQDAQSPAAYLSHIEELPTVSLDEEEFIEKKIEKMEVSEELDDEQQKEAKDLIKKEKGIFARNVEELGRTERTNHVIDTDDAAPIKQNANTALENIQQTQERQKHYHDTHHKLATGFKIGKKV
ncbi:1370_t:CDS:2, partial [Dentiscutata erythropus]